MDQNNNQEETNIRLSEIWHVFISRLPIMRICAAVVVGSSKLRRKKAQDVVDQLRAVGANLLGVIKNDVTSQKSSKKKYYHYYK